MDCQPNGLNNSAINNISSISPSQISTLKSCKLKLLFQRNLKESYFPDNPSTLLGNIIHYILKLSNVGAIAAQDFEHYWSEALQKESNKFFEKNPLNIMFQPNLIYWIPYYASKKKITFEHIKKIKTTHWRKVNKRYESEIAYDFTKGVLDAKIVWDTKALIIDYKTGPIYKYNSGMKIIKDQYVEQMKTYGLLIYKTESLKAEKILLRLENIATTEVAELIFSSETYEDHYTELRNLFTQTNNAIKAGNFDSLAEPSGRNCTLCKFRPRCKKFNELLRENFRITDNDIFLRQFTIEKQEKGIAARNNTAGRLINGIPSDLMDYITKGQNSGLFFYALSQSKQEGVYYWSKYSKAYNFFND